MKKICCIGSATQDIILHYDNPEVINLKKNGEDKVFLLLEEGSKLNIQDLCYYSGGGATNVAVALKKLNFDVSLVCKIGDDLTGKFILEDLKRFDIKLDNVIISKDHKSGLSCILPTPSKDRVILAFRGANSEIEKNELKIDQFKNSDLFYISPLTGKSAENLRYISDFAKENKILVACNPGMGQIKFNDGNFLDCLRNLDILILNLNEAKELLNSISKNQKIDIQISDSQNNLLSSIRSFFKIILNSGPEIIAVTNGSKGVYVCNSKKIYFHESLPTQIINSLGAGDAFVATFIANILEKNSIQNALFAGLINATSVISNEGAKTGLLDKKQLEEKSKEFQFKIEEFDL